MFIIPSLDNSFVHKEVQQSIFCSWLSWVRKLNPWPGTPTHGLATAGTESNQPALLIIMVTSLPHPTYLGTVSL